MDRIYHKYSLNIDFNQLGGSYIINSASTTDPTNPNIIIYPEVTFLLKSHLGSGGSGSVQLAEIITCSIDPSLNGKHVAIKSFTPSNGFTSEQKQQFEKNKLVKYQLDNDDFLVKINYISTLFFDIKTGPLSNTLIYEYGGDILSKYKNSPYRNEINNKRILIQLFTILRYLTVQKNNMQNDLKAENIVYLIDKDDLINIQLIDFGASFGIDELYMGAETLKNRANMNSPESIKNYLVANNQVYPYKGIEGINERDFSKWYYYPFISILFFLYTGKEYSTGPDSVMKSIMELEEPVFTTPFKYKMDVLSRLLNNDFIKYYFYHNTFSKYINKTQNILSYEFAPTYTIIQNLFNNMCKPIISERMGEETVLEELNKL